MRNLRARRFGSHKTKSGDVQVSTRRYQEFSSELLYLNEYLNSRLLPTDPEEIRINGTLSNLQNLLEHESEELIRFFVLRQGNAKEQDFQKTIENGYVSFKTKCDWMLARTLIDMADWKILDEIRILRNNFVHTRPTDERKRYQYLGLALLTRRAIQKMSVDVRTDT